MENKNKAVVKTTKPFTTAKVSKPWGQAMLRASAVQMLRDGSLAPSAVMGNILAISASSTLDLEMLGAQPRPMSDQANRIIADAMRRSRLPHADVGAIVDELMYLAWTPKRQPEREAARPALGSARARPASAAPQARPPKSKPSANGPKKAVAATPAKAPIIVRKASKLSDRQP